jgi:hypothetical protein
MVGGGDFRGFDVLEGGEAIDFAGDKTAKECASMLHRTANKRKAFGKLAYFNHVAYAQL